MSTTGSHPAFPLSEYDYKYAGRTGLTKREEFAKAAMIGLLANPEDHEDVRQKHEVTPDGKTFDRHYTGPRKWVYTETCAQAVARLAVEQADALIEALNKP